MFTCLPEPFPKMARRRVLLCSTALASAFTQRQLQDKLAMTGEITLRGKILPVGGIKEKILAARRAGIKTIIMSRRNEKDVKEIEPEYIKGLEFHFVENATEVLELALLKNKVKNAIELTIPNRNKPNPDTDKLRTSETEVTVVK